MAFSDIATIDCQVVEPEVKTLPVGSASEMYLPKAMFQSAELVDSGLAIEVFVPVALVSRCRVTAEVVELQVPCQVDGVAGAAVLL